MIRFLALPDYRCMTLFGGETELAFLHIVYPVDSTSHFQIGSWQSP